MNYLYSAGVIIVLALTSFGSFQFGAYKCGAGMVPLNEKITQLTEDKLALGLAIATQNASLEVAQAQSVAAVAARVQAEKHANDMAAFSKSRMQKLQDTFTSATSCDAVLLEYWNLRQ